MHNNPPTDAYIYLRDAGLLLVPKIFDSIEKLKLLTSALLCR